MSTTNNFNDRNYVITRQLFRHAVRLLLQIIIWRVRSWHTGRRLAAAVDERAGGMGGGSHTVSGKRARNTVQHLWWWANSK